MRRKTGWLVIGEKDTLGIDMYQVKVPLAAAGIYRRVTGGKVAC